MSGYLCQRCTACCRWPGDVYLEDEEVTRIARFLGLEEHVFVQEFTRIRANRTGLALMERANHECIMLEGDDCRIHDVKPAQCEGFPNSWNFPGWRKFCKATPAPPPAAPAGAIRGGQACD